MDWQLADWPTIIFTTLGTLVGAVVGVAGVYFGFRLQRQKEYYLGVDNAIANVMQEIANYATDVDRYETQRSDRERVPTLVLPDMTSVRRPNPFRLSVSLDIAEMRTRDEDQEVIHAALHSYRAITTSERFAIQLSALGMFSSALGEWRAGRRTLQEVHERLREVQAVMAPPSS